MRGRVIAAIAILLLAALGWFLWQRLPAAGADGPPRQAVAAAPAPDVALSDAADAVLAAIAGRDGAALARLAHPDGVRISPSAHVDPETDRLLQPAELGRLFTDPAPQMWGYAEGSGDEIQLSGAGYADAYLPAKEALAQRRVTIDGTAWQSNTVNNIATAHPGARSVEYLVEPPAGSADAAYARSALRLVFRDTAEGPRLVGIVTDRWSP